jgi:hypothetical protein
MKTRCTAHTKAGRPCRAWAVAGSRPPRCAAHRAAPGASAPPTLDGLLADLDDLFAAPVVGAPIDPRPFEGHARLLEIYVPLVGRLLRACRDRDRRGPGPAQELERAIDHVLDELSQSGDLEL